MDGEKSMWQLAVKLGNRLRGVHVCVPDSSIRATVNETKIDADLGSDKFNINCLLSFEYFL